MNDHNNEKITETPEKREYVSPELIRVADIATATQNGAQSGVDGALLS